MCKVLKLSRSSYYHILNNEPTIKEEGLLIEQIKSIFHKNRRAYGTRRIKKELLKLHTNVCRSRIGRIMTEHGFISKYTIKTYKPVASKTNEDEVENVLYRDFSDKNFRQVVVSDLTYVRVNNRWNYICVLLDLFNREIIGYSAGAKKDAS